MLQEVELTRDDDSFFLVEEDDEEDVKEPEEQEEEVCFLVHVISHLWILQLGPSTYQIETQVPIIHVLRMWLLF